MEISLKENFKIKALVIILIASLLFAGVSFFSTVKATDVTKEEPTITQQEEKPEIKLNRKVKFTGDTHKTYNEGSKIRKSYKDGKVGEGIISVIKKNRAYGILVIGEGWISEDQVLGSTKFIDITFPQINELKDGNINTSLKINGEFTDVKIDNKAFVTFEEGELKVHGDGKATVEFIKKDGERVELLASNYDGEFYITTEEKAVVAGIRNVTADATLLNKVKVEVTEADGKAVLDLSEGKIGLGVEGKGTAKLTTTDGQELLEVNADGDIKAKLGAEGLEVNANSNQRVSVLAGKIRAALNERATLNVNKEKVKATAGGTAIVNDNELANGDAAIEYKYGDEDPIGSVNGHVLGNEFNKEEVRIPLISGIKALIGKISLAH